jgi:hypothetical protein
VRVRPKKFFKLQNKYCKKIFYKNTLILTPPLSYIKNITAIIFHRKVWITFLPALFKNKIKKHFDRSKCFKIFFYVVCACKPNSVIDNYLSGIAIARDLERLSLRYSQSTVLHSRKDLAVSLLRFYSENSSGLSSGCFHSFVGSVSARTSRVAPDGYYPLRFPRITPWISVRTFLSNARLEQLSGTNWNLV